jgi:sn1-specific diacylglycerol lipase
MPALRIFGKKTLLAGDDLRLYTVFALSLRLIQIVVLIPVIVITKRASDEYRLPNTDETCRRAHEHTNWVDNSRFFFIAYASVSFITAVAGTALEVGILVTTNKGTPTQPELRKNLTPLCLCKMIPMSLLRASCLFLGVVSLLILDDFCTCGGTVDAMTLCPSIEDWHKYFKVLITTHCIEAIVVATYMIYFSCKAKPRLPSMVSAETKWKMFCSCCCGFTTLLMCCLGGGRDHNWNDYTDIALVLIDYFDSAGIVDVVLSDIIVGFRVLAQDQKQRQLHVKKATLGRNAITHPSAAGPTNAIDATSITSSSAEKEDVEMGVRQVLQGENSDDEDYDNIVDMIDPRLFASEISRGSIVHYQLRRDGDTLRFAPTERKILSRLNPTDVYAVAEGARFMRFAAGIYLFPKKFSVWSNPCLKACQAAEEGIKGDRINEICLLKAIGIDSQVEVIYAQLGEGLAQTPYSIILDHAWKTVVVTIRGTLSLDDIVADLTLKPESLNDWGKRCGFDGSEYYVHKGVLKCTGWIYKDLER